MQQVKAALHSVKELRQQIAIAGASKDEQVQQLNNAINEHKQQLNRAVKAEQEIQTLQAAAQQADQKRQEDCAEIDDLKHALIQQGELIEVRLYSQTLEAVSSVYCNTWMGLHKHCCCCASQLSCMPGLLTRRSTLHNSSAVTCIDILSAIPNFKACIVV